LKPEWWGSPLAQEQKYQGRKKPVTRNDDDDDDDDDNNNNNNNNNNNLLKCKKSILYSAYSFFDKCTYTVGITGNVGWL
jgi:hypothetical protein